MGDLCEDVQVVLILYLESSTTWGSLVCYLNFAAVKFSKFQFKCLKICLSTYELSAYLKVFVFKNQ